MLNRVRLIITSYLFLRVPIFLLGIFLLSSSTVVGEHYPGVVGFKTDRSILLIPQELVGVVFDTAACEEHLDSTLDWRMIGDLLVDSAMTFRPDSVRYVSTVVSDSTQIQGIRVFSAELQETLEMINPVMLRRRFPRASFDTSPRWDKYRERWYEPSDLSPFFRMTFSDTLSVEEVVKWLKQVPGVEEVTPMILPMPRESDEIEENIEP
ncbi:MAG: hypothetical protein KOO62_13290 [candidate division Zixibacteria bacterium]|nr:hypothetical protein [candidate division Zixibacteria bacterium]